MALKPESYRLDRPAHWKRREARSYLPRNLFSFGNTVLENILSEAKMSLTIIADNLLQNGANLCIIIGNISCALYAIWRFLKKKLKEPD